MKNDNRRASRESAETPRWAVAAKRADLLLMHPPRVRIIADLRRRMAQLVEAHVFGARLPTQRAT
eukprot:scaffold2785_cov291-Pinguiococcus_pyrenoidosus.AAC.3